MPESRLGLASLIGGLVGGVSGLSFAGLSVLPLSSVMPGPLPEPDMFASEPAVCVCRFVMPGADVVLVCLTL